MPRQQSRNKNGGEHAVCEAGGDKQREAIRQIAQAGDGQQNAESLRHIARPEDQVPENVGLTAEEDAGAKAIAIRFDRKARQAVELLRLKCSEVFVIARGSNALTRHNSFAASSAIDTRLKNTASKARSLLSRLSKTKKITAKETVQSSMKSSAPIPKRHIDSSDRMLAAVAVASPDTMIEFRTIASPKMPPDNDDQVQDAADS